LDAPAGRRAVGRGCSTSQLICQPLDVQHSKIVVFSRPALARPLLAGSDESTPAPSSRDLGCARRATASRPAFGLGRARQAPSRRPARSPRGLTQPTLLPFAALPSSSFLSLIRSRLSPTMSVPTRSPAPPLPAGYRFESDPAAVQARMGNIHAALNDASIYWGRDRSEAVLAKQFRQSWRAVLILYDGNDKEGELAAVVRVVGDGCG